jgi:hypothetical protein
LLLFSSSTTSHTLWPDMKSIRCLSCEYYFVLGFRFLFSAIINFLRVGDEVYIIIVC